MRLNTSGAGYTRILAFKDGFQGVTNNAFDVLTWAPIDPEIGGTILRSQRFAPRTVDEKRRVADNLLNLEVDTLVVVGGDGSLSATRDLQDFIEKGGRNLKLIGFPRTIDNDIRTTTLDQQAEVALCPGFPSAALKISYLTRALRTTPMSSAKIFILETMGRDSGWLAAACALGGAELVLIPEYEMNMADWDRFYERVAWFYTHQSHVIIGVSEGIKIGRKQVMDAAMGPRRLGGVGIEIAHRLRTGLGKRIRDRQFEIRYQQAGYIPRMGAPSLYDLQLSEALGSEVGTMLRQGRFGEFPIISNVTEGNALINNVQSMSLATVEKSYFPLDQFYNKTNFCLTHAGIDFFAKIIDQKSLHSLL